MRSQYADYFNHDEHAESYDREVTQEDDPIRTGYASTVDWVGSRVGSKARVLDLGSGTGNTILALPDGCEVTAVDISRRMTEIAKDKLRGRSVTFVLDDILDYVENAPIDQFGFVVSTYALHHLTPDERERLFSRVAAGAPAGVHLVIGDLMYRNDSDRERVVRKNRHTCPDLAAIMEDEFFWNIELTDETFARLGWSASWKRFSDLSWAVELTRARRNS